MNYKFTRTNSTGQKDMLHIDVELDFDEIEPFIIELHRFARETFVSSVTGFKKNDAEVKNLQRGI